MAAFLVGLAKTSVGGLATISVALFALALPARESTAALLLVLIVGDVVAVSLYRRDADWGLIRSLLPGLVPGLVVGTAVLAVADDDLLRRTIGLVLVTLLALHLAMRLRGATDPEPWSALARGGVGVAAGLTTMVANAGGPVMALYLAGQAVEKRRFVGTAAWFFLGVNLAKLPFSVGLGLVAPPMLGLTLALSPVVLLGGLLGPLLLERLRQDAFEVAVLAAAGLSAVPLLVT